ncbi:hypothetical protein [Aliivibrio fischeri]|uniref:hypothetical protein n=1 Tax=Aliivibrio fischeri TaxID=668 RepID=UPI0007C5B198|nr:hypothetical protein [Aliivibrio fischeri]
MTTTNYSILELKDLLNDLENLSTCLMGLSAVSEHIDSSSYHRLVDDQYSLIQKINSYASMLRAIDSGEL